MAHTETLAQQITEAVNGLAVFNRAGASPEVWIYGPIGDKDDGVTAKQFIAELEGLKSSREITVRINSEGGLTSDGLGIYNALKRFPGRKVVQIDGIALSAGSFVAMAGDEIRMARNALWMMHNAWDVVAGDGSRLRKRADDLDRWTGTIANIYAERTKIPRAEILSMLAAETWLDADAAKRLGFVDAVDGEQRVAAKFDPARFQNVPVMAFERAGISRPLRQRAAIETELMRQQIEATRRKA